MPALSAICAPAFYFDLDGVLADFDAGAARLGFTEIAHFNRSSHHLSDEVRRQKYRLYEAVADSNFYRHLPLMPRALEIWRAAGPNAGVLTSVPRFKTCGGVEASMKAGADKRAWFLENFEPLPKDRFFVIRGESKANHLKRLDGNPQVLIDDRPDNIAEWTAAGGHGILHVDPKETLAALAELTARA